MKYSILFTILSFVSVHQIAQAVPTKRDAGPTDIQILNFALTLEHLESAFYKQGLDKHTEKGFAKANYPPYTRRRYGEIAMHESTHVQFLTTAIEAAGGKAVEPCEYHFPDDGPKAFIQISAALENVGASAYAGAAAYIADKAYLTAAATILSVESRHAAWINSAVNKANAWGTAFDAPLDVNQVYTLASGYIKKCPSGNGALLPPVKAFPTLSVPASARPGKETKLTFDLPSDMKSQLYAAFMSGLDTIFVPFGEDKKVMVPDGLKGTTYVLVTDDNSKVDDSVTVAGPAIMMLNF